MNEALALTPVAGSGGAVRSTTLDNGLRLLVQEVRTAPLVSVWCWYHVGSKDEGPGLTGASHWVEHMNFKGTTRISRDEIKGSIERYGGFWNGYTWIDQTTYVQTATSDALDQMLFVEAERMHHCLYEPAACDSERTVIISELQGGENDPDTLLDIELTATAFKAHPYRHPTIGWLSDLEAMTREDLYGFYRRYYVPNNATLVVVGDVDAGDAARRAAAAFGGIPAGETPPRLRASEPPQLGERRVTIRKEGTTAYLKVAYHAPPVDHDDFAALLLLDAALSGAKGLSLWSSFRGTPPQRRSRLYRALVEQQLASAVGGMYAPTAHPFLFMVSVTAAAGAEPNEVEAATLAALDAARDEGVSAAELQRAKRQLRARMVFDNESVTNLAHQLGFFSTVSKLDTWFDLPARIEAVTVGAVARVAATHLTADNRTVGWVLPA